MAFARTKSLDHFPSDDAAGFALGAALGITIPQLHKYPGSKVLSFSMFSFPLATGLSARLKLPVHRLLASGRKYKQD